MFTCGVLSLKKSDWTRWRARWAGLGADLALLGCVGAWDLAVLGVLGWVGHGSWLWWARWAGLGKVVVRVF